MRILVTGARGMLGTDLREQLIHHEVTAADHEYLDIADAAAVRRAVAGHDVVINAAAYTSVDEAEKNEDLAYRINADGPRYLAEAAKAGGARFLQVSTDYVFDGTSPLPYSENAPLHPVSAYGRTKAAGERFVRSIYPDGTFIVRTAWLYGRNGSNFAGTMLTLASSRQTIDVVSDQRGQPTWTRDLAVQIQRLLDCNAAPGIYHGTNSGDATWFDFAQAVFAECGLDPSRIRATDSASFAQSARRPANSVLGHAAWRATPLPAMRPWRDALHDAARTGVFEHLLTTRRSTMTDLE
ncbi:dTDP-4-dehydrorhamnose reductase [Paramicrobacterium agarici]|nr:dTDP-4-dehydrorhamnose reductase [Microbacterium agarici]